MSADVGLLASVCTHVDCEVVHPGEACYAALLSAPVGLLSSMEALVLLQVAAFTGHKLAPWVATSAGGSGAGMDAAVHCEVGFALACKPTAWLIAAEGPISWV